MILLPFAILALSLWTERADLIHTFNDCFLAEPWQTVIYKEGCNEEN
jgi:hypothetical protein